MNGKSWKTTLSGIGMVLGALGVLINILVGNAEFTMENVTIILGGISGGVGLIFSKDKDVTGAGTGSQTVSTK